MDAAPMTAMSFLSFLAYLGTGVGVLVVAAMLVSLITPHKEFTLIRAGNASAATAYAGTLIGLALPLHAAIQHSVSLLDALLWGAAACAVQAIAYLLARAALPRISQEITDNVIAGGIFAAGVSISVGLINAAAMTP